MDSDRLKVGIGISTYNGALRVDELLDSLQKHTDPVEGGYDLYVLDDGGKDSNFEQLNEICAQYDVAIGRHATNMGISKTWNDLTRHFKSEYMVLLNDDLILVDDWLNSLLYFAENNKFASAGLPMWVPQKTGKPESGWKKIAHGWKPFTALPKKYPKRVPAAPGCCFIFKRTLFDFLGGFDERYQSFYEEVDFAISLAEYGYPSYILPYPWIYHLWARTFAENPELGANERMDLSRARFTAKWGAQLELMFSQKTTEMPKQRLHWLYDGKELHGYERLPHRLLVEVRVE